MGAEFKNFGAPVKTGKEKVVRVRYDEGLAIRIGPEPCVGTREGAGEASVGERIGQRTKPGDRSRSRWSEGRGPGGTRVSGARAGHRTGKVFDSRWAVCGKPQRGAVYRQVLSVGAGCLNWACPDLCGGRSVMAVPTATPRSRLTRPGSTIHGC